ncbi:ATP-binding cassette domain-containing protein [Novosphingobium profundi]|uniref:molybdenum ABC transporter ATP-binding protein n=1 Tax=Novosphingobium profundi TaxID=1774954 RepID=UPI001BDA6CA3|nr:ATP-binding cassette domain-containing protein [Novosphingobium profundi]MBT0668270.1 ATP-binding cassette domain-containing protein [Novosphingobium profundi]
MPFDIDVTLQRASARITARFEVGAGLTALFGTSGAGKTSVLNAIAGLIRPEHGRIAVGEDVLFDSAARIDRAPEKRACGYVFQDSRLFPHKTVRDNLLFGWRLAPPARRWMALEDATEFLGIEHLLKRMPRTLSGGEMQRVAIGRALLSGPRFLLMDEPLSSLDEDRRSGVMEVIARIRDELALPILYVSHDRREVDRLADHVVTLTAQGTQVREGLRPSGAASVHPAVPRPIRPTQTHA